LAGFEKLKDEFAAEGISVIAASVDDLEKSQDVQADLSFPVVHGVTRDVADTVGAWWDGRRNYIQPSEFMLGPGGRVLSATYSTGPVGRLDAQDALALFRILKSRAKKG
jgi:peroxiredoxin